MGAVGGCCSSKTLARTFGRYSFSSVRPHHPAPNITLPALRHPTFHGGVWGSIRLDPVIRLRIPPLRSSPLLSLPDESNINEVDCGIPETSEPTFRVRFVLRRKCLFGQQFFVVGEDLVLGSWEPSAAIPMDWSKGDLWTVEQDMPIGSKTRFKFILKGAAGGIEWQPGPDRVLKLWNTSRTIIIEEDWHSPELQKASEELPDNNPAIQILVPEVVNSSSSVATVLEPTIDEMIDQNVEVAVLVPGLSSKSIFDASSDSSAIAGEHVTIVAEPLYHSNPKSSDTHKTQQSNPEGGEEPTTINYQPNEEGFPSEAAFNMELAAAVFKNDVDWSLRHLSKLFSALGFHQKQLD